MSEASTYWTLHVFVSGQVQGVFFRESTRREAASLGLSGWVRNLADGRVEATFIGTREQCERALGFVKLGPPAAVVTRVDEQWEETTQKPARGFEVR